MAWSIAIPGEDANPKLEQNLRSGPFPIMWTRGHEGDDGTWDPDSPWSGDGGHVLFSNGKVDFLKTPKDLMKKVFLILPPKMMMMMTLKLKNCRSRTGTAGRLASHLDRRLIFRLLFPTNQKIS